MMNENKFWMIIMLFVVGIQALKAQTEISLSEAIEMGLEYNYQIQVEGKQLRIAEQNNTWKATGRYPTVDFNLSANNAINSSNNPVSFVPKVTTLNAGLTPSIDARWVIFDGYTFKINKTRLEELEKQQEGKVQLAIENTIRTIMLAYYQVIIQKKQLETLQEVIDLSRSKVAYQNVKKSFAQANEFEVLQSENAYLNDSTTLLIQQNSYDVALLNLKLAIGGKDEEEYMPNEDLKVDNKAYLFEELEQKMFEKNLNLKQLYFAQQLSHQNTKLKETQKRYPTIALGTGLAVNGSSFWQSGQNPFTQEAFGGGLSSNVNFYINLTGTYRLYDAAARKRNLQNARIEEQISQLNIDDLKQNLSTQLKVALERYHNQLSLVKLTENLIQKSTQHLKIAEERYQGALLNSFDYRTVQLAYVNASQARLNAIFNLKNTEIELVSLMGGLIRE